MKDLVLMDFLRGSFVHILSYRYLSVRASYWRKDDISVENRDHILHQAKHFCKESGRADDNAMCAKVHYLSQ